MSQVFIGLGSNLGDRTEYIRRAMTAVMQLQKTKIKQISSVYETEPVGRKNQPQFLNMAIEIDTSMNPQELLRELKTIELNIGRSQNEHWGAREIDLDILYYGSEILRENQIQLPHPEITHRRFVLVPLKEIAPDFVDPLQRISIEALLHRCPDTSAVRKTGISLDEPKKV